MSGGGAVAWMSGGSWSGARSARAATLLRSASARARSMADDETSSAVWIGVRVGVHGAVVLFESFGLRASPIVTTCHTDFAGI